MRGYSVIESLPLTLFRQLRDVNDLYFVSYHPEDACAFIART